MQQNNRNLLSLWCIYFTTFYDTVAFAIFLPSLQPYLESLGKGVWFTGIVVACFNVAAILSSPLIGYWSSKRSLKETLVFTSAISLGGNCVYYFVENPYAVLISRMLVGLAAGSSVICQTYVAMVSKPEERTAAMAKWMIASVVGFTGGSALSSIIAVDQLNLPSYLHLNIYSAPALVSGILAIIALIWSLLFFFHDPPKQSEEPSIQVESKRSKHRHAWKLFVWLAVVFMVNAVWTSFEVLNTPTMINVFGWDITDVGFLWIANGVITAVVAFTMGPFQKLITEKGVFFFYWIFLTSSPILVIHYTSEEFLIQYLFGFVLMACAFVSTTILSVSIFSQWVSVGHPGNWMAMFQVSSRLAQIVGAAASGAVYNEWGSNVVYGPLSILCLLLLVILLILNQRLFPRKIIGETQPLLNKNST